MEPQKRSKTKVSIDVVLPGRTQLRRMLFPAPAQPIRGIALGVFASSRESVLLLRVFSFFVCSAVPQLSWHRNSLVSVDLFSACQSSLGLS